MVADLFELPSRTMRQPVVCWAHHDEVREICVPSSAVMRDVVGMAERDDAVTSGKAALVTVSGDHGTALFGGGVAQLFGDVCWSAVAIEQNSRDACGSDSRMQGKWVEPNAEHIVEKALFVVASKTDVVEQIGVGFGDRHDREIGFGRSALR